MRRFTLFSLGFVVAAAGCSNNSTNLYDAGLDLRGRDFSFGDLGAPYAFTQRFATPATTQNLNAVTWDASRFVIVGDNNTVVHSIQPSPGILYTSNVATISSSAEGYSITGVASDGTNAIATAVVTASNASRLLRSVDLLSWNDQTGNLAGIGSKVLGAVSFNGYFISTAQSGLTYFSTDGNAPWVPATAADGTADILALAPTGATGTGTSMIYNWLGVGLSGAIDTIAFASGMPSTNATYATQTYPAGVMQTLNAVAGTSATSTPTTSDYFVAVGNGTSPTGGATDILYKQGTSAWVRTSGGVTQPLAGVAWTGKNFIAVGKAGTILVSATDVPTNWVAHNLSIPSDMTVAPDLRGISADGPRVVIVGTNGTIYSAEK